MKNIELTMWLAVALLAAGCCGARSIDDVGGVRLVYEIDRNAMDIDAADELGVSEADVQNVMRRRLRGLGYDGIEVAFVDNMQIEISIAGARNEDLPRIEKLIATQGVPQLLIVANENDDAAIIALALKSSDDVVTNSEGEQIGRWANVSASKTGYPPLSPGDTVRAKNAEGEQLVVNLADESWRGVFDEVVTIEQLLNKQELSELQMLLRLDPNPNRRISGRHVREARVDIDALGNPAISFMMTDAGRKLLGALTSQNLPDASTGFHRRMAIVLNGEVVSAPRVLSAISTHGQITGDFTMAEVEEIAAILNAGRLPVILNPEPISETWVQPR